MATTPRISKFRKLTRPEKELSCRVRQAREARRYTQARLAAETGLSRDQLASIEAGRVALRFVTGWKLCQFLNLNPAWLATGRGRRAPFTRFDFAKANFVPDESTAYLEGFRRISTLYQPSAKEPDPSIFDSTRPAATPDLYVERIGAFTRLWLESLPKKQWGPFFYHISTAATSFIDEIPPPRKKPAKK